MKNTKRHDILLRLSALINLVLMTAPFAFTWLEYYLELTTRHYYFKGNVFIIIIFTVLYAYLGRIYDAFEVAYNRISSLIFSQVVSLILANGIMYIIILLVTKHFVWPLWVLGCLAVQIVLSVLWSVGTYKWYFHNFKPKQTIVIYGTREGFENVIKAYRLEKKFHVKQVIHIKECLGNMSVLNDCETVFISGISSHDRNLILKYCVENSIEAFVIPKIGDIIMSGGRKMHLFHLPIFMINRYRPNPEYVILKRLIDILVSLVLLIVLSPFMIIVAIIIKAYDGGPVFYKQKRLTLNGKEFNVIKFRSMKVNAEKDGKARLSSGKNDDRITPIGRFIRACRFDEVPQFLNILKGDMTLVGPRPERPEIARKYCEKIPEFSLRLQVKAGLTGYAQVYGKYNTTPYDKLQMDLMYIANPSPVVDFEIFLATIKILFIPESTEGVSENHQDAMHNGKHRF